MLHITIHELDLNFEIPMNKDAVRASLKDEFDYMCKETEEAGAELEKNNADFRAFCVEMFDVLECWFNVMRKFDSTMWSKSWVKHSEKDRKRGYHIEER